MHLLSICTTDGHYRFASRTQPAMPTVLSNLLASSLRPTFDCASSTRAPRCVTISCRRSWNLSIFHFRRCATPNAFLCLPRLGVDRYTVIDAVWWAVASFMFDTLYLLAACSSKHLCRFPDNKQKGVGIPRLLPTRNGIFFCWRALNLTLVLLLLHRADKLFLLNGGFPAWYRHRSSEESEGYFHYGTVASINFSS